MKCVMITIFLVVVCAFLSCKTVIHVFDGDVEYAFVNSESMLTNYKSVNVFPDSLKEEIAYRPLAIHGDSYAALYQSMLYVINFRTEEKIRISEFGPRRGTSGVSLSDQYVVWIAEKKIEIYDRQSQDIKTLNRLNAQPTQVSLDGNRIVWSEKGKENGLIQGRWAIYNSDVYAFDIALNKMYTLSQASGQQTRPSISGDWVVWQDNRDSRYKNTVTEGCSNCPENRFDIYLYDFNTSTSRAIVQNKRLKSRPVISGQRVVWEEFIERAKSSDYIYGNQADLFMMDLQSSHITRLTHTPDSEVRPIFVGNLLLWHVRMALDVIMRGPDGIEIKQATGIYVLDFDSGEVHQLSNFKEPSALFDGEQVIVLKRGWGTLIALDNLM